MSLSTITRRRRNHAEFHAGPNQRYGKGVAFVVNKLFERIKDNNLKAIIFFLNARGGETWSQKPPSQTRVNWVQEEQRLKAEALKRDDEMVAHTKDLTVEELKQVGELCKKLYGEVPKRR